LGELPDEIGVRGFAPLWGAGERSETEGVTPPHLLKPVTALSGPPPSRFHRDSFQSHGEEYLLQTNPSCLRPSPPDSRGSSTLTGEKTTLPHFVIYPPNRSSGLSRVLDPKWDRERLHPVAHWGGNCPALAELRG